MEATVWLLIKMGGLLAVAGVVFFGLGWWARGQRTASTVPVSKPSEDSKTNQSSELARTQATRIAQLETDISAVKAERDHLLAIVNNPSDSPAPAAQAAPVATAASAPKRATKTRPRKSKK